MCRGSYLIAGSVLLFLTVLYQTSKLHGLVFTNRNSQVFDPIHFLRTAIESNRNKLPFDAAKNGDFCSPSECPLLGHHNRIRESWIEVPNAPNEAEANPKNKWANITHAPNNNTFSMLLRDPVKDMYISGGIYAGRIHEPPILKVLAGYLPEYSESETNNGLRPVFIDVGANIGYFSSMALAMGAQVISFEPFLENAAVFMSTVRKNQWQNRSHLYLNAVSYKTSSRVHMASTHADINLSNMQIRGSSCVAANDENERLNQTMNLTYGIDYMEAISLDMVMLTHHKDIERVDLLKIDVETHEIHALNSAMHFLCNRVVKHISVEVEYLKAKHKLLKDNCQFEPMRARLEEMGYTLVDTKQDPPRSLTGVALDFMTEDVLFVLQYVDQPPARRLAGAAVNPCRNFTLPETF